jgi:hypothetical protein
MATALDIRHSVWCANFCSGLKRYFQSIALPRKSSWVHEGRISHGACGFADVLRISDQNGPANLQTPTCALNRFRFSDHTGAGFSPAAVPSNPGTEEGYAENRTSFIHRDCAEREGIAERRYGNPARPAVERTISRGKTVLVLNAFCEGLGNRGSMSIRSSSFRTAWAQREYCASVQQRQWPCLPLATESLAFC